MDAILRNFGLIGISLLGIWQVSIFYGIVSGIMTTLAIVYNHYSWKRATVYITRTFIGAISVQLTLYLIFKERLIYVHDLFVVLVAINLLMVFVIIGYIVAAIFVESKRVKKFMCDPKTTKYLRDLSNDIENVGIITKLDKPAKWLEKNIGISIPILLKKWAARLDIACTLERKPIELKTEEVMNAVKEVIEEHRHEILLFL